jgi:3-deoxy-D-manno-octulosonic acid kinase
MTEPSRTRLVESGDCIIEYDKILDAVIDRSSDQILSPDLTQAFTRLHDPVNWFDPLCPDLRAQEVLVGGRAAAWFVRLGEQAGVLRHFRRGGLIARLIKDRYFWLGASRSRAFAEFSIMQSLWLNNLPVPQPLAAAVWRHGLTYRAALITARIEGAKPLAHTKDARVWAEAGRVIARLHHAKTWHADLNVFNLLVDQQSRVWVIDFDRARIGHLSPLQRSDNLSRLLRSVRKVAPELEQEFWPELTQAYALEEQELLKNTKE